MADIDKTILNKTRVSSRLSKIIEDMQRQHEASTQRSIRKPIVVREVVVALMGATGAGKSTFIKNVTSDEAVVIGEGLQSGKPAWRSFAICASGTEETSETQDVRSFRCEHQGNQFSLVDTPGFNDTYRSDREILQELADWLLESYRNGQKISGIIYLHSISAPRVEGSSMRNLRMFRELCGEEFMRNVILGTTFWDTVSEGVGAAREKELVETEGFFKAMKDRGCEIVRISDSKDECLEILSWFAAKQPSVMRIQQELFEGKSLEETGAASAVSQELAELQRQSNEIFADTKKQMERVLTKSDLEKAYSRKLGQRKHDAQMGEVAVEHEALQDQLTQEEAQAEEKITALGHAVSRQNHGYQVQLEQLNNQLRALKSTTKA